MLPIVRTFISLPAGVAEMPFWRFTTFTLARLHPLGPRPDPDRPLRRRQLGRVEGQAALRRLPVAALIVLAVAYFLVRYWRGATGVPRPEGQSERPRHSGRVRRARARVLGAVQGPTELLPVSSSAHLRIVPWPLGWDLDDSQRRGSQGLRGRRPRRRGAGAADRPAAPDRRGAGAPRRPPRRRHRPLLPARGRHRPDARGMDRPPARRSPRHRLRPHRRLGRDGPRRPRAAGAQRGRGDARRRPRDRLRPGRGAGPGRLPQRLHPRRRPRPRVPPRPGQPPLPHRRPAGDHRRGRPQGGDAAPPRVDPRPGPLGDRRSRRRLRLDPRLPGPDQADRTRSQPLALRRLPHRPRRP